MLNVKLLLGGGVGGQGAFYPVGESWESSLCPRHKFEGLLVSIPRDTCSMVGGSPCNVDLGGFVAVFHLCSREGLVCSLWQWFPKFFDHLSGKILSMYL